MIRWAPSIAVSLGMACLSLTSGCVPTLPELEDPCIGWEDPGPYRFDVETKDGKTRHATVYMPTSPGPRVMAVGLHGAHTSDRYFADVSNLAELGIDKGFVSVFPDGLGTFGGYWNAGACCGGSMESERDIDDVTFLEELTASLMPRVCAHSVVGLGHSNGSMMVQRWACEGQMLDAVVSAAGPLMSKPNRCKRDGIPLLQVHGVDDPVVPLRGGVGAGRGGVDYPSVDETVSFWRDKNRCTSAPFSRPQSASEDCREWTCDYPTQACLIEDWKHAWPGGTYSPESGFDLTQYAWKWWSPFLSAPDAS